MNTTTTEFIIQLRSSKNRIVSWMDYTSHPSLSEAIKERDNTVGCKLIKTKQTRIIERKTIERIIEGV